MLDPAIRLLDQSRIGPVLTGDRSDLGDGPPVTALLIQNTNPMVVRPDSHAVRAGFVRDDLFVCVHEQFMTETAAMADIVLPATTFLEHDDIYAPAATRSFRSRASVSSLMPRRARTTMSSASSPSGSARAIAAST